MPSTDEADRELLGVAPHEYIAHVCHAQLMACALSVLNLILSVCSMRLCMKLNGSGCSLLHLVSILHLCVVCCMLCPKIHSTNSAASGIDVARVCHPLHTL